MYVYDELITSLCSFVIQTTAAACGYSAKAARILDDTFPEFFDTVQWRVLVSE